VLRCATTPSAVSSASPSAAYHPIAPDLGDRRLLPLARRRLGSRLVVFGEG
jgi:hypothetical protein